jgi:hypothetical protein
MVARRSFKAWIAYQLPFLHPAKVGDDRLNRLWRLRHNTAIDPEADIAEAGDVCF